MVQIFVRDNNVDQALKALKKKMQREGSFREMKRHVHYEKPSEKRARQKAEAVRRARKLARKRAQREGLLPPRRRRWPGPDGRLVRRAAHEAGGGHLGLWRGLHHLAVRGVQPLRGQSRPAARLHPHGECPLPHDNAWALFERAEIDGERFNASFSRSRRAGSSGARAPSAALLSGAVRPRMVAALMACKTRFKVGCITNNMASGRRRHGGQGRSGRRGGSHLGPVRPCDREFEGRHAKTRPRIYRMMCEALAVPPAACVYLDDLGINCNGGRSLA